MTYIEFFPWRTKTLYSWIFLNQVNFPHRSQTREGQIGQGQNFSHLRNTGRWLHLRLRIWKEIQWPASQNRIADLQEPRSRKKSLTPDLLYARGCSRWGWQPTEIVDVYEILRSTCAGETSKNIVWYQAGIFYFFPGSTLPKETSKKAGLGAWAGWSLDLCPEKVKEWEWI